jgi:YVTN family beta-propeller protein
MYVGLTNGLAQESGSVIADNSLPKNIVVATIPVGKLPECAVVSPNNATLYVSNFSSDTVSVIDTASNTVTFTIPVGTLPSGLAITPDGSTLYVANNVDGTVSVINTSTNTVTLTVAVGFQPDQIALGADGKLLYVPVNFGIAIINTASNQIAQTISTSPSRADALMFTASGRYAYALCELNQPRKHNPYPYGLLRMNTKSEGLRKFFWGTLRLPDALAIADNDTKLFFTEGFLDNSKVVVSVYNIALGNIETRIPLPNPGGRGESGITPNGKYVYFPNGNLVFMISTAANKIVGKPISIPAAGDLEADIDDMAIAPNGHYAYAVDANENSVSVIDISPN